MALIVNDRYAGDEAWREWFEICSVAGCGAENAAKLRAEIVPLFWNEAKGALMHLLRDDGTLDPQLTRYPNMFGLSWGYFDDAQRESVLKNVIFNDSVMKIQTPYMRFYELDALCRLGQRKRVLDEVRAYWGGMLDVGATSFWENFDLAWTNGCFRIDEMPVAGKRDIHGDYGEFCYPGFRHSLCHGWASGPAAWCIRHVLGIRPLDIGCRTIEVKPFLGDLEWARGGIALPDGRAVEVDVMRRGDGSLDVKVHAPDGVSVVR